MNDHVHPVMRSALGAMLGEALDPQKNAALVKKALLLNLIGTREALQAQKRETAANVEDVEEQICRINGEPLMAEWHRLKAEYERNPTAEAMQLEHRAWVVAMADFHLKNGTPWDGHCADEIEAEMEAQRTTRAAG